MNKKVMRHKAICDELNSLYERKNHDYGDSFHQTFVEEGLAMTRIRLGDKFSRFKTLSRLSANDAGQQQVTDESIRDTLMDLANYAIMTILEMDEEKGMETPDPNAASKRMEALGYLPLPEANVEVKVDLSATPTAELIDQLSRAVQIPKHALRGGEWNGYDT